MSRVSTISGARARVPKRLDLFVLAVLAAGVLYGAVRLAAQHALFFDFHAFWCAGSVLLAHGNPYAQAPLYRCEAVVQPLRMASATDGIAVPVPYPGYVLAVFTAFALLPFPVAAFAWLALSVAAAFWTARILTRYIGISVVPAFLVVVALLGLVVLPYGETAAVGMFALVCTTQTMQRGRWNAATLSCAVLAILPQVALPVWIAAAMYRPQIRLRLLCAAVCLALLDLLCGGTRVAMEYFGSVLPAHAMSEAARTSQYGVVWFFTLFAPQHRAATLADAVYFCAVALVLVSLRRFAEDTVKIVVMPALAAVAAAPFVHFSEIVMIVPALAILLRREDGVTPIASVFALCA
ncbi:MAG: hypothetical protein JO165_14025, partial [Candidatus Eremiobacteraeota bacterium]|nr:hypothetical protein [Candidatus Eremiobacteraeota bacterium]